MIKFPGLCYAKIITIILFFFVGFPSLNAQQNYIRFRYITNENGLSQNSGRNIVQDNYGFIWFGTESGLNKYDGNKMIVYKYNPTDTNGITNNYINTIFNDSNDNIVIGTDGGGLNYFDTKKNKIIQFRYDSSNVNTLSDDVVLSICEDNENNLWIGTSNGLNRLNIKNGFVTRYFSNINDKSALTHNYIRTLCKDNQGVIWVGTPEGLCKYNATYNNFTQYDGFPKRINSIVVDINNNIWISSFVEGVVVLDSKTNKFIENKQIEETIKKLCNNQVYNIVPDESDNLWIATTDSGLIYYDKSKNKFFRYQHELYLPNSLPSNQLRYVYIDKAGVLWIGSFTNGICYYDTKQKPFNHYATDDKRKYFFNSASAIMQDSKGYVWLGMSTGLVKLNMDLNTCEKLIHNTADPKSIPDNSITKIIEDRDGLMWVATNNGGIFTINKENNACNNNFLSDTKLNNLLKRISAWELFEDADGDIWIGTWDDGAICYNKKTKQLVHYKNDANNLNSISGNNVISIVQDKQGCIWFGTWEGGLNKFDKKTKTFKIYKHNPANPNSLSMNIIMDVHIDNDGILWIGTFGAGFDKFDPANNVFSHYTENDGLANNTIFGIKEDNNGNLWISSNKGITKFNKTSKQFRNYNITDGVQGSEFSQHGSFKCNNGYILFSGCNGFNYFNPDSIKDNQYVPPIVITDFKIFNHSVNPGDSTFLKLPIFLTKEIRLTYREAVISFDFASLHYAFPEKITYYYMMEGFDEDWINAGNNRTAKYTNLKAGEYLFKVKATNCDGVLNAKETAIKIIISPPFWETIWFYSLLVVVVILIFYSILRIRLYKLKRDKQILEAKVVERTAEINKQKEEILEKNKELLQQKEEILTQRDEIEIQRNDIEHKNKNITASITYAERIQQAILPDEGIVSQLLPESFIFYKPKDIVSGDFYWISDNNDNTDQIIYIAAVDCTGHGVPGALMSIMGHSILKQAINEQKLKQPAEIIQFISKEINILLRQKDKNKAVKDGMDIALLAFHKDKMMLEYAGVHNPLYVISKNELSHYKADTFPIGEIFTSKIKTYTNTQIKISKGDTLYIFSDGFVDQYGGKDRKKYMSKRFKEFLISLQALSLFEQKQRIEEEFYSWKGDYDQIDDVLIIGVRI